ncbi:MAG: hypothetical protein VR70_16755 [Rhodospirillaceae bacterium BRH_c57]|nr:MAG: hypothetical protein VR70_16755 [Rhodospirillaceae bacterium BRH_c57]
MNTRNIFRALALGLVLALIGPVAYSAVTFEAPQFAWHQAPHTSAGLAPAPADEPRAVVQVYAARAFAWRGIFSVHTWIVTKPASGDAYTRYDVVGWGGGRVAVNRHGPDAQWYGSAPTLLVDLRGDEAEALLPRIQAAIDGYPFASAYRTWPGPNSNTFVAHIGRSVPELGLDMPANAIGKDYRAWTDPIGAAPSGSGVQISLLGALGVIVAPREGLEINVLGLSAGVDLDPVGLRLPAVGAWRF